MCVPQLSWLTGSGESDIGLIWIDDCFFAPDGWPFRDNEFQKRAIRTSDIVFLQQDDARSQLGNLQLGDSERRWIGFLLDLREGCKQREIAFGVANFDHLDSIETTGPHADRQRLYLVDVHKDSIPASEKSQCYGFWVVRNWLGEHRDVVRFATRHASSRLTKLDNWSPETDLGVQAEHMLDPFEAQGVLHWVDLFLHDHRDHTTWWLAPPNPRNVARLHWFDRDRAHDPSDGDLYEAHMSAVAGRFPSWVAPHRDSAAKALTHTVKEERDAGDRQIPWECLLQFFPNLQSDLDANEPILLPVRPGLAFLMAALRFFKTVDKDFSGCYHLCRIGQDHIGLVLQGPGDWYRVLWRTFVDNNSGNSGPALIDALAARVPRPGWVGQSNPPFLSKVLWGDVTRAGMPQDAARDGDRFLKLFAYPWVSRDFVGIGWAGGLGNIT